MIPHKVKLTKCLFFDQIEKCNKNSGDIDYTHQTIYLP